MSEVQSNIDYFLEYKELEGLLLSVTDKTKVFRPSNGGWYLKNTNTAGFAEIAFNFGQAGDLPVAGDWDGDGDSTVGVYRNGVFDLLNTPTTTTGVADLVFTFGEVGDQPIAGDWDGDGVDTIGTYNSSTGVFLLGMSNNAGAATLNFAMGLPGDLPVVGDWNGDGTDTIGVYRPSTGIFYLRNVNDPGFGEIVFSYGGVTGDQPIAGDWNNDGIDTVGVYRSNTFYLKNANTTGNADLSFALRNPGDLPVAGNWDGLPPPVTPTRTPTAGPTPTIPPTPTPSPAAVFSNASFTYDGDGKRVKSAMTTNLGTTTTYFVGAHYESTNGVITKYYYAGAQRIAMRSNGTVFFTLGDHLGSTSLTTFANGNVVSEQRYKAWGEVRYASGNTPTQYQYTGQFSYESQFGLYFYNARWYDGSLGRFTQADSIISSGVQGYDRYAYGNNSPAVYIDPSGHCGQGSQGPEGVSHTQHDWLCKLRDEALRLSELVETEDITDAETLAMLLDFAAPHYLQVVRSRTGSQAIFDKRGFANDIGIVLGGNVFNGVGNGTGNFVSEVFAGNVNRQNLMNELANAFATRSNNLEPSDISGTYEQYYVGFNAFGNSGFASDFAGETGGNQVAHFAGGLSASARGPLGERVALSRETPGSPDYLLHLQAFQFYDDLNLNLVPSTWIENHIMPK